MTQKLIKNIINQIYSKKPKHNYSTNKTDEFSNDNVWSLDILDVKDYGPGNNRFNRYVLIVIDSFSKFGWTIPLKNKNAQTIKDSFEDILITSKRQPNLIEATAENNFMIIFFQNFLNIDKIKLYSTNKCLVAVFAERFNRTIKDLLKKQIFEKGESNWIVVLPTITKQYINGVNTSTKLTPIQASIKKNEGFPHKFFFKQKKFNTKVQRSRSHTSC